MPDKDLESRRTGQRVDPTTGEMFTKEVYDPDKPAASVSTIHWSLIQDWGACVTYVIKDKINLCPLS